MTREDVENHIALWRAYVSHGANPTEIELWGAVRTAVDCVPDLLAENDQLRAKAAALDAIEEWLRERPHRFASASQLIDTPERMQVRLDTDGWRTLTIETAPTLAAAIEAALEKANAARS